VGFIVSIEQEFQGDRNVKQNTLNLSVATAFGLGLSPVAPGTCAALLGVAIHVAISFVASPPLAATLLGLLFVLTCIANHLLTPWAQDYWSHKDPKHFVLDEVAGYLLIPVLFHHGHVWQVALWGFLLFRVLDIVKVPPARQIDRRGSGAWAILMDDVVAALYTVGVLHIFRLVGPILKTDKWLISY
jgi:phosphatidylglycerophosphatase A